MTKLGDEVLTMVWAFPPEPADGRRAAVRDLANRIDAMETGLRAELAKVRAKSEERRRLLEECGKVHDDQLNIVCRRCGESPCRWDCAIAAALKEDA